MPVSFDISASTGSYQVSIGTGLVEPLLRRHADAMVLVDERLAHVLPDSFAKVVRIAATEENKSLERIAPVIAAVRELGTHRRSHLLAIGGGIIQDIATFVASIYMRGIPWSYLPTTLLGMVDSCVGGKSSINVDGYKNLVGNFYPPKEIIIDLDFLKTLDAEQVIGGLCEAAKICYSKSYEDFDAYLGCAPTSILTSVQAEQIVTRSLRAKQWFIEIDEFDQKERLLLNFGHTFGHALESATEFRISHGVAVGIGMLVAEAFARQGALLKPAGGERIARLNAHIESLLGHVASLSAELDGLDIDLVIKKFDNDKKHLGDRYRIVIPSCEGELELLPVPRNDASRADIHSAYCAAISRLKEPNRHAHEQPS